MIEKLLAFIAEEIENDLDLPKKIKDGDCFENYVYEEIKKIAAKPNKFDLLSVKHNGVQSFPDLKVTFTNNIIYGVEIKFSVLGNWRSKGNSVFESLSNKNANENAYTDIYVFFGRKPRKRENIVNLEVRYAPYGLSIDRIEVTHSPRFAINMQNQEHNLVELFGEDSTYADFRIKSNEEKNELLRNYFNKINEDEDKWYMPRISEKDITTVEPIQFSSLSKKQRKRIVAESIILFPTDILRTTAKYSNVGLNMISKHFVYSTNLRDNFSASGKVIINERNIKYPRILKTLKDHSQDIKSLLRNPPYEDFDKQCYETWSKSFADNRTIQFDPEDTLEYSFEKIIKYFKPQMKIEDVSTGEEKIIQIDLEKFYQLEIIN